MPNWIVEIDGARVRLVHGQNDDEGPLWLGVVSIHQGAPSADSHPELAHAFLAIMNEAVHREFVRQRWTYEIPDTWGGNPNYGARRRFMILRATGALSWTLALLFPISSPRFVFRAVARGFAATPQELPRKEPTLKASNDATAKPASLTKGDVPEAKPLPPEAKEGVKSVVASNG